MFNESLYKLGEAIAYIMQAVSSARYQLPGNSIRVPSTGTIFVYSTYCAPGSTMPVRIECWLEGVPGRQWRAFTVDPVWIMDNLA